MKNTGLKTLILIWSLLVCSSVYGQKSKLFMSVWQKDEYSEAKIPESEYSFFKKGKFFYHISNNEAKILVDIKIDDSEVQNKILKQGLILWLNVDGKTSKKMGIRFPIGSQNSSGRRMPNMPDNSLYVDGKPVSPLSVANTIELIGFPNEPSKRFPSENAETFSGFVKFDKEGILHYKMKIPIEKIPVRNTKEGVGIMPFNLGIEYGAVPSNNQKGAMAPPPASGSSTGGSGGGRSGGGRSGGGSRGGSSQGMSGAGSGPAASQPSPVQLWIKNVKLALEK